MVDENQSDTTYFLYGDILAGNKNVESQMKFFVRAIEMFTSSDDV